MSFRIPTIEGVILDSIFQFANPFLIASLVVKMLLEKVKIFTSNKWLLFNSSIIPVFLFWLSFFFLATSEALKKGFFNFFDIFFNPSVIFLIFINLIGAIIIIFPLLFLVNRFAVHKKKNLKIFLFIAFVLFTLFFYPKKSYKALSEKNANENCQICKCLGLKRSRECYGVPYVCKLPQHDPKEILITPCSDLF